MEESLRAHFIKLIRQIAELDSQVILLVILIAIIAIVYDNFDMVARRKKRAVGLSKGASAVSVDGSKTLSVRLYISEIQGLSGRPDALIIENGEIIPVERKPLARKLRDRYVAQLLVYMRLIEEFEGKKPPYGYLILGSNCRRIKIENTPGRQAWLQKIIDEMRGIIGGAPAVATPQQKKCAKCDVASSCKFRADQTAPQQLVGIGKR